MRPMTKEQAYRAWEKNPNRMIAFEPNACPHDAPVDRWVLADRWSVLGTGFSLEDIRTMRDTIERKRG
jgi:hypothetical protein